MSSNRSLALARQLSHGPSLVHALFHAVWLDQLRRDPVAAGKRAEALACLAMDQGQFMYVAVSSVFLGWVAAVSGEAETGLRQMREGIGKFRSTGARNWIPFYAAMLADALWHAGDNEEAFVVLREARGAAKSASDRFFWEAEVVRLEGELLLPLRAMRESEAEELFRRAITISGEQQAKSLELRAAMSLGRLWRSQGRHTEVRELLDPIYNWFTEGFDTPDLIEAKALLDDLERA